VTNRRLGRGRVEASLADHQEGVGRARPSRGLRLLLVGLDAAAVAGGWLVVVLQRHLAHGPALLGLQSRAAALGVGTAAGLLVISSQRLYRSRTCSVKPVELVKLWRASLVVGVFGIAIDRCFGLKPSVALVVLRPAVSFLLLAVVRDLFRAWLNSQRRQGRFTRPVVVLGTNDEALSLHSLIEGHPELGYRVKGVVGDEPPPDPAVPWLGPVSDTARILESHGVSGVMVATTAFSGPVLNPVIRQLLDRGIHVQLSTGLRGIAGQRMSVTALAYESLFYLEHATLTGWQTRLKRALDVSLSLLLLSLSLPLLAVAAVAIRLEDGAPSIFRQVRVGRHGQPFTLYKLRTMVKDAEAHLAALARDNQRSGPLFKIEDDPRTTRLGRILRATSVDELPQLVNVLKGEMSLVGPRPALPSEVAEFDPAVLARHSVLPGITGLWQVEARDKAQFEAYYRFDLYYVENWSITLDVAIIWSTIQSVLGRSLLTILGRRSKAAASPPAAAPAGTASAQSPGSNKAALAASAPRP
jgi:exopolysaccharide biosynthesis polyprenyl glycosylphosphotransferase